MRKSLPLTLRHAMYNLRGGFLIRPLTIAVALGCAGAFLSWLEEEFPVTSTWVPTVLFPSHADPQVAQVILAGIAASIMTVVSIVFAILLMTLTLASMQFSPRIIVSFSRDRVTQWTLGIFLGTFLYCMAALPAARSIPHPFAPVATVLGAMVLALICVGLLLFFIHHISQAISVNHIVDRIAVETEAMIDEIMPWPHLLNHHVEDAEPLRPKPKTECSDASVSMGEALSTVLSAWRQQTPYCQPTDFVFASFKSDGAVPLAMSGFVADHLRPAAIAAGVEIEKGQRFGLHNLRHSLSHWLVNKGKVEPKTVQSMLRHSKIQTTLDLYTQGDSDEMSTAQQLFADAVDWCGLEKPTQVM